MKLALVIVLLLGHQAAAHACRHRGQVIYREEQSPLAGYEDTIPDASVQIFANGAWDRVQEMPDGQEPASQRGCLKTAQRKALNRAIARAKFLEAAPEQCDAVADTQLSVEAPVRKKQVTITSPCGTPADPTTARLIHLVRGFLR